MRSLTVFIVGDGAAPAAVRSMVESWTRAGIVTDSLWLSPREVTTRSLTGPPEVTASAVSAKGTRPVDLFAEIGRFRVDLVRVVAAHLVLQDGAVEDALDASATIVAEAIEATLPHGADGGVGGTRLHRTLMVVPVSGAEGVSRAVFMPNWEVNTVISPEDRPDIDRASVFIRHPGNFVGHAAAALSAVGGILRGVDAGVLDDEGSDSTSQEADAVVARVSIRSVTGEEAADAVADRVLEPAAFRTALPSEVLPWARPSATPDRLAESAAAHLLATPEWRAAEMEHVPAVGMGHDRFWSALRTAAVFNLKTVGSVLSWGLTSGRARIERDLTDAIVGSQGGVLVTLGPRPVEDLAAVSSSVLRRESARIDEQFRLEGGRTTPPPPTTWSTLRTLSFGLVDGGELGDFQEPRSAGRRELLPADYVVVPVEEFWQTRAEKLRVRADDPPAMQGYLREVKADKDESGAELEEAEQELQRERDAFAQEKALASRRRAGRSDEDDVAEPTTTPAIVAAEHRVAQARSKDEVMQLELERFTTWFQGHSRSMLWRVGEDLGRRSGELSTRIRQLDSARQKATPNADGLKRSQRVLRRWWAIVLPVWLALIALVLTIASGFQVHGWKEFWDDVTTAGWWLGGITAVAAVLLIAANHRFYKAVRQYDRAIDEFLSGLRRFHAERLYTGREKARLDLLSSGLKDWVRILGECLYTPWGTAEARFEDLPEDVIEALPASMGVARQSLEEFEASSAVLLNSYSLIYRRGWCSQYFNAVYEVWEAKQGVEPYEGYLSVDLDTMSSSLSPRNRFRQFWADGSARDFVTRRVRDELGKAARDGSLDVPNRVVRRLGRYGDDLSVPEPEFYRATATEGTSFAIDVFSPAGRQARRHYVDHSIAWVPKAARGGLRATTVELRDCAGPTAVRVDRTRRIPASEIALFEQVVGPADLALPSKRTVLEQTVAPSRTAEEVSWH